MSYTRQSGQLFRRALRVATGDDNARMRIAGSNTPDQLPCFAIRFFGDSAGVDNNDIRGERRLRRHCHTVQQFLLDCCAFGLRSAATEIRHEETPGGH
jgi:hypothetical protein